MPTLNLRERVLIPETAERPIRKKYIGSNIALGEASNGKVDMSNRVPTELENALQGSAFGFALFDPLDRLQFANDWYAQTFNAKSDGTSTWESIMRGCHATGCGVLIQCADIDAWIASVRTKYRCVPVRSFQCDLADGRWVWVTESLQPNGWLSVFCSDVSPLKATEFALRDAKDAAVRLSITDPLTGLYNRRFIMGHLEEILAASHAGRWPFTLAMLDIDHFKRINDTQGHDVGDVVLCHFAEQLRIQLRPLDAVGRIGGEEFLLALPNTGIDGAVHVLARVRRLIHDSIVAASQPLPEYTFSAGVARATSQDTVDTLFRRADQALYRAKGEGRDRDFICSSRSMRY